MIRSFPLKTRQPDLLLISAERIALGNVTDETPVLTVAPELVVEIASGSDRPSPLNNKLSDYASIGVNECWVVRPSSQTVEVFPDLTVAVADVFAE